MSKIEYKTSLHQKLQNLQALSRAIQKGKNLTEKLTILAGQNGVQAFLDQTPVLNEMIRNFPPEAVYVVKAVIAIGQGPIVFADLGLHADPVAKVQHLVDTLLEVEKFYDTMGGIVGYQSTVLQLILDKQEHGGEKKESITYHTPEGPSISQRTHEVFSAMRSGIESTGKMGEIYPLGGAGDRFDLRDEKTGEPLPVAQLAFCGRSLLEGMIRDLQGREFLYYKLFGEQVVTPIAMMTSHEKHNHRHIGVILDARRWFGRPKESFMLFVQPLVPVVTHEGKWEMMSPLHPVLKPGGHGVIWKQAIDQNVFDWMQKQGRFKSIVRQINNPVAGIDNGLLALIGIGCSQNKDFGYISCPRLLDTPEGMIVLVEKQEGNGYEYAITNIEYTEFKRCGIEDLPAEPGSPYSVFPSNTNILFVDLVAIKKATAECPLPGMLINMRNSTHSRNSEGNPVQSGRLESTMQNIADHMVDKFPERLQGGYQEQLRTFLIYNERRKTLSVTKQAYREGGPLVGTPEGCFYEMLQNSYELLSTDCRMQIPSLPSKEEYLQKGPSFILHMHPALGPLFDVIGQKIRGGSLAPNAEMVLEISEADIENIQLDGSLIIEATDVMGKRDSDGFILYGADCGKCVLKNVTVQNRGIDKALTYCYWKNQIVHQEKLHIILNGNAELYAEDVIFTGNCKIEVPDGHCMILQQQGEKVVSTCEPITRPSWKWGYFFDSQDRVVIKKEIL